MERGVGSVEQGERSVEPDLKLCSVAMDGGALHRSDVWRVACDKWTEQKASRPRNGLWREARAKRRANHALRPVAVP